MQIIIKRVKPHLWGIQSKLLECYVFEPITECLPLKNIENLPTLLNTNKIMYTIRNLCRDVLTICNIHTCYIFLQYTGTVYKYNIITYIYCTQKCKQLYYMYIYAYIHMFTNRYCHATLSDWPPSFPTHVDLQLSWPAPLPPPHPQIHKACIKYGWGERGVERLTQVTQGQLNRANIQYIPILSIYTLYCTVQ